MPVIDASVVVDWVAPDADPKGPAGSLLRTLGAANATLVAPRLLREEVANALLTGMRRGRWDGPAADAAAQALWSLPIVHADDDATLRRAWEFSRRYDNHSVYDMIYVALADQIGEDLFTADERLCRRLVGVTFVKSL
jgi:predicted nucleic acid-binding protein